MVKNRKFSPRDGLVQANIFLHPVASSSHNLHVFIRTTVYKAENKRKQKFLFRAQHQGHSLLKKRFFRAFGFVYLYFKNFNKNWKLLEK